MREYKDTYTRTHTAVLERVRAQINSVPIAAGRTIIRIQNTHIHTHTHTSVLGRESVHETNKHTHTHTHTHSRLHQNLCTKQRRTHRRGRLALPQPTATIMAAPVTVSCSAATMVTFSRLRLCSSMLVTCTIGAWRAGCTRA